MKDIIISINTYDRIYDVQMLCYEIFFLILHELYATDLLQMSLNYFKQDGTIIK
jgi:hypothetical protein